jgi:sensor histidine kinase YesM
MVRSGRRWVFLLISINLAVTVITAIIQLSEPATAGWDSFLHSWAYSLIYANVTGLPAVFLLPRLLEKVAARKFPLLPVVVLGCLACAAAGSLVAQAILLVMRVSVPQAFWRQYLHTLIAALPLALAFGIGAFFYSALRDRLRDTEEKLREQRLHEERTLKLAAEARLSSLESRIHPHFLFNTLNSISSLISIDPTRAEQVVGQLATLLRSSLDNTNQPLIALSDELALVEDYLAIETLRLGGKLSGSVDVPAVLRDVRVPPFAVQSLVENAVKHGITPQKQGGKLSIAASAANGQVCIEVADTGPGFDSAAIAAGHGLDNLVERLNVLFGPQASLNILRRDDWCVVQLVLPRS